MPALRSRNYRPGPARRVMQEDYWCEAGQRAGFRVSLRATPRRVSESAVCDDLVRAGPDEPYVDRLRRAAYPSQARAELERGGAAGVLVGPEGGFTPAEMDAVSPAAGPRAAATCRHARPRRACTHSFTGSGPALGVVAPRAVVSARLYTAV